MATVRTNYGCQLEHSKPQQQRGKGGKRNEIEKWGRNKKDGREGGNTAE